ncbi:MAG: glycosyl transferase family 2, partial [uncultured bacterium]
IITDSGRVFLCHQPEPYNKRRLLSQCYIGQPSCFYRKELLQKVGLLNVDLHLAMDYDLWLRFAQEAPAGVIKAILSNLRFYENTKSALFINKVARISLNLSKQYSAPVSVERLLQYYNYWRIRLSQALHHDISTQVARFNRKTLN